MSKISVFLKKTRAKVFQRALNKRGRVVIPSEAQSCRFSSLNRTQRNSWIRRLQIPVIDAESDFLKTDSEVSGIKGLNVLAIMRRIYARLKAELSDDQLPLIHLVFLKRLFISVRRRLFTSSVRDRAVFNKALQVKREKMTGREINLE